MLILIRMFKIIRIKNIYDLTLVFWVFFDNVTLPFLLGSQWKKAMLLQFQDMKNTLKTKYFKVKKINISLIGKFFSKMSHIFQTAPGELVLLHLWIFTEPE